MRTGDWSAVGQRVQLSRSLCRLEVVVGRQYLLHMHKAATNQLHQITSLTQNTVLTRCGLPCGVVGTNYRRYTIDVGSPVAHTLVQVMGISLLFHVIMLALQSL